MPSNIYKSEPAIGKSEKGQANGVATLDANGLVPGSQLDIVNALDSTSTDKPLSAAQGKALNDSIGTLTVTSDANTVSTGKTERFQFDSSTLNTPYKEGSTSFTSGWVESFASSSNYATQICHISGDGDFTRTKKSGTWGSWQKLALNSDLTSLFKMVTAQTSLNITSNYAINDDMSVTIPNDYSVVSMCPVFIASDVIVIPIGISNSRLYYRLENKGGTAYGVKTVKINVLFMKD